MSAWRKLGDAFVGIVQLAVPEVPGCLWVIWILGFITPVHIKHIRMSGAMQSIEKGFASLRYKVTGEKKYHNNLASTWLLHARPNSACL